MNITNFLHLLRHPSSLRSEDVNGLERLVEDYPFFQSARVLYLKGLKKKNSYLYNNSLKTTAVYTNDRSVLFDFITTDSFNDVFLEENEKEIINQIEVVDETVIYNLQQEVQENKVDELTQGLDDFEMTLSMKRQIDRNKNKEPKKDEIFINEELIAAIEFNKKDKFSFNQWLQLTSFKPIDRSKDKNDVGIDEKKQRKKAIIDEFIASKPKIKPNKNKSEKETVFIEKEIDSGQMMTETLAKLYIKQQKYQEAIEAYEVLSLKIPEKSAFFADRIKKLRKLI